MAEYGFELDEAQTKLHIRKQHTGVKGMVFGPKAVTYSEVLGGLLTISGMAPEESEVARRGMFVSADTQRERVFSRGIDFSGGHAIRGIRRMERSGELVTPVAYHQIDTAPLDRDGVLPIDFKVAGGAIDSFAGNIAGVRAVALQRIASAVGQGQDISGEELDRAELADSMQAEILEFLQPQLFEVHSLAQNLQQRLGYSRSY